MVESKAGTARDRATAGEEMAKPPSRILDLSRYSPLSATTLCVLCTLDTGLRAPNLLCVPPTLPVSCLANPMAGASHQTNTQTIQANALIGTDLPRTLDSKP